VHALAPQKRHGLNAIGSDVQMNAHIGGAKGFLCQPDISGTVFDQKNF
jgi:hypothetical protein